MLNSDLLEKLVFSGLMLYGVEPKLVVLGTENDLDVKVMPERGWSANDVCRCSCGVLNNPNVELPRKDGTKMIK